MVKMKTRTSSWMLEDMVEDGNSDNQVSKDDEMKKSVKDKRPDTKDAKSEDQVSRRPNSRVAGVGPQRLSL